jgi:hypothetical protein
MVVTALIGMALMGCGEDPTIWSATARSPDGNWLAIAHTIQHSGPGANGVETIVEIRKSTGFLKHSQRVLAFMNDGGSMGLKMDWVSPARLEVVFRDDPDVLYYEVTKTSGIEISVRNVR